MAVLPIAGSAVLVSGLLTLALGRRRVGPKLGHGRGTQPLQGLGEFVLAPGPVGLLLARGIFQVLPVVGSGSSTGVIIAVAVAVTALGAGRLLLKGRVVPSGPAHAAAADTVEAAPAAAPAERRAVARAVAAAAHGPLRREGLGRRQPEGGPYLGGVQRGGRRAVAVVAAAVGTPGTASGAIRVGCARVCVRVSRRRADVTGGGGGGGSSSQSTGRRILQRHRRGNVGRAPLRDAPRRSS